MLHSQDGNHCNGSVSTNLAMPFRECQKLGFLARLRAVEFSSTRKRGVTGKTVTACLQATEVLQDICNVGKSSVARKRAVYIFSN